MDGSVRASGAAPVAVAGSQAPAAPDRGQFNRLRAVVGGSIGNLVEWFDWYAYAAASLYFAPVFFPKGDATAQLLQSAAVFAVGFAARPVGGWLMGLYADRAGRRAALSLSVGMMCFGSLVIALTPGFAVIGAAAPAILLAARVLQGLSLGGEYGASATYLSEVAGKARRGFWSSFSYVTLISGQLLALALMIVLQRTLPPADMTGWGWRVPFLVGALLAVVAFWLRRGLSETASFEKDRTTARPRSSTLALLRDHPREVLTILGLTAGGSLIFYVYTTYMQKFLVNSAGFSRSQATEISAATLVVFMLIQPLFGWLSDHVGRKPMLALAFAGGALATWPLMRALGSAPSPLMAFWLITAGLVLQSGYTAISAVVKAELFPTKVRALGVALPYAIANALFGGTAEYLGLWFKAEGIEGGFFAYASIVSAVAFVVVMLMPDTRRVSRIQED